jgi:pimeloyl-ACP methyl ester carboxylesterase
MSNKTTVSFTFCLIFIACQFTFITNGIAQGEGKAKPSPDQVTSGYIDVGDGKLFFEKTGEGEPLVLIHDGLLHSVTWDEQFIPFSNDFTVIRYDRRGYGQSTRVEYRYSNIRDLYFFFDKLGIERAGLMGMSAGGGLAIDFALAYPEKVSFLVLVGAVVNGLQFSDHIYNRGGHLDDATRADRNKYRQFWFTEDPYAIYPENRAARENAKQILESNPHNFDLNNYIMLQPPSRPAIGALGEISVPTLIVVGEHDIPDVHAHAGAIQGGIPNAERVIVSDSGHLIPMEQPEVFNKTFYDFLKRQEFYAVLETKGFEDAAEILSQMLDEDPGSVPFTENDMNLKGYEALQDFEIEEAITLFRLNVIAYPESFNTYDSLAEAYLTRGDRDLAIKNYEKSLELNPDNTNAVEILKRIQPE